MKHIMIDVETLGVKPGCVIFQIGACVFDPSSGEASEVFTVDIDPEDAQSEGLTIEAETAKWWLLRGGLKTSYPQSFRSALEEFAAWITAHKPDLIWAWGMDFERPILEAAFAKLGGGLPWSHWQSMDARTVWKLVHPRQRHEGQAHHALEDCLRQSSEVAEALHQLSAAETFNRGEIER